MKSPFVNAVVALCIVLTPISALAQPEVPQGPWLLVHPKTQWPAHLMLQWDFVEVPPPEVTPEGTVYDLDASLLVGSQSSTMVESQVVWEITRTRGVDGVTIDQSGRLTFPDYGRAWVRARLGDLVSEEAPVWHKDMRPLPGFVAPLEAEEIGEQPGEPRQPVPTQQQIEQAVSQGLANLENYGFDRIWSQTLPNTDVRSNSDVSTSGGSPYLTSAEDASYAAKGTHRPPSGGLFNLWTFNDPTIVLQDALATSLVQDGMIGANGRLTNGARAVLHELVHALADQLGISLPEALEEVLAHAIESIIASAQVDLVNTLNQIGQNQPTNAQRARVANLIKTIRNEVQKVRQEAANTNSATNVTNMDNLLRLINLDDSDGDGIPDVIEEIIDEVYPGQRPQWIDDLLINLDFYASLQPGLGGVGANQ